MPKSLRAVDGQLHCKRLNQQCDYFDTVVRQQIREAILEGFVQGKGVSAIPPDVALGESQLNQDVYNVIAKYVNEANEMALTLETHFIS